MAKEMYSVVIVSLSFMSVVCTMPGPGIGVDMIQLVNPPHTGHYSYFECTAS